MKNRIVILAILSAAIAVMFSTGIRASFGLFLQPIAESLNIGREPISFALALSNLIYGLPLVGIMADRIGSRWVLIAGGLLYMGGLVLMSRVTSVLALNMTVGVMVGLALSATSYVVVLGAVGQLVPEERRSRTFGIITAAGSSGMFIVPPLAQILLDNFGWQTAIVALAGVVSIILFLAFGLPWNKADEKTAVQVHDPFIKVIKKAGSHIGYWLLNIGLIVCGFHVAFIGTHLPAYLTDNNLPAIMGATALSLIGGFNIIGSFLSGWLGDRYSKKHLLSIIYWGRSIVIALFIFLPLTQTSAFIFSAAIGALWLATVPLTSGTVAHIFGTRYLATLYGVVFLSHQVGAFLGVWLGGHIFDATGSYNPVWITGIVLGIIAAIVHLPIEEKSVINVQTT